MNPFTTRVAGIPCQCLVLQCFWLDARNRQLAHHPLGSEATDDDSLTHHFVFTLLDRTGYPALWLEEKLEPDDNSRLRDEYLALQKEATRNVA